MRPTKTFTLILAAALGLSAAAIDAPKGRTMGLPTAPIVMELYSDFMCPHCKHLHEDMLPAIILDFVKTGKAFLIFREFPLDIPQHLYARPAANFAVAAARVGKYQQVSDALFKNQAQWGISGKVWETVATALTPEEQKKVQALVSDPTVLAEVQRDYNSAQTLRLTQTPTMLVTRKGNSKPWTFWDDYKLFSSYVNDLLAK